MFFILAESLVFIGGGFGFYGWVGKINLESSIVGLYICGMETKSVRISKYYHNEVRRYLADKGTDGENIKSFIDVAIFQALTRGFHKFSPKPSSKHKVK